MSLLPFLHRVTAGEHLSPEEAREAMTILLDGRASTPQISAFLVALLMKGETSREVAAFARVMREKASHVDAGLDRDALLDTAGTGGGVHTFNISTIAAVVIAGAGGRVAKHGNRSFSTHCGSADLLEALGVRLTQSADRMARSIREIGLGFLFAPSLHPAMKHANPARLELKMRTVFNILGPLTNPAGARTQLIGAPSPETAGLMAGALTELDVRRAFVVHGFDGLDEVSTTGPTMVFEVRDGRVEKHVWTPADFGVPRAALAALEGGDPARNCAIARAVLAGEQGPPRDIVLVNAAAGLVAAGLAPGLRDAVAMAAHAIDSGAARARLDALVRFSQEP